MKTRKGNKAYPLTSAQKLHYYSMKYCPKKQVLNIGTSLTIQVELQWDVLEKCIIEALERCESMRVQFAEDKKDGSAYQYVAKDQVPIIKHFDFGHWKEEDAHNLMTEWTSNPFEMYDTPMYEIVMIKMPDELVMVPMDGILVEQVLVNLLENAAIHGKWTSEITIRVLDEDTQVQISVEDNGAGIKESALPRIFDGSMQSEEGTESDSKRNMGIGLSVCKTIVKAHKGNMKAENKEEGGAKFTFWLPK